MSKPVPIKDKPEYCVGDIFRQYGDSYQALHAMSSEQRKVFRAVSRCRTSALGGHLYSCGHECGFEIPAYSSCRNRHCPMYQGIAMRKWLEERLQELLPVPHFHAIFTIPHGFNPLIPYNERLVYDTLFEAASYSLDKLSRKYLGGRLGVIAVLHTWGQKLQRHAHLHCLVSEGTHDRSVIHYNKLECAMNTDLEQLRAKDQYIRWGTQTLGIAMMIKIGDKGDIAQSIDACKGLGRKAHAISLSLWDYAADKNGHTASCNDVIARFAASICYWAEDHIGELSSFQRDFQTLVSLKAVVKTATQECSVPGDNKPEETLRLLGQILVGYLQSHDKRYPDELFKLKEWPKDDRFLVDFAWVRQHITYLGSGISSKSDPPDMVVAYASSMLAEKKGTYALFNDSHVEYISQQRAAELGLPS